MNTISQLNSKYVDLNRNLEGGKIISNSLKAESEPNLHKMIFFSIFTFGIYYLNYKYKHNPERIFSSIKQELQSCLQTYEYKLEELESNINEGLELNINIEGELNAIKKIARENVLCDSERKEQEKVKKVICNITTVARTILTRSKNSSKDIDIKIKELEGIQNQFLKKIYNKTEEELDRIPTWKSMGSALKTTRRDRRNSI